MQTIIQINIPYSDIGFVIEAIEMRSSSIVQTILNALDRAEKARESQNAFIEENEEEAPWGRKKDGTPKKRPGRAPRKEAK